jgi:hypothetical protein
MTQSLSNLMNSPLALIALLLWVLLLFLVVRQCKMWAKASQNEKIIYQNHSSIPTKEYKLSEFEIKGEEQPKLVLTNKLKQSKLNSKKQVERLASLKHSWDV